MRTDLHLHTPLCRHAVGNPVEYVATAQQAGLDEIGFADHNPMPERFDDWRMELGDLDTYCGLVAEAGRTGFPVRLGLECDFIAGQEGWIDELSTRANWDFLIGSVHYIAPGWDVDNPKYIGRFRTMPVAEIWDLYWKHYVACIRSGLFDFVAHADLPKKFGFRPTGDLRRYYEPALQALLDQNLAFELNTAGWRKEAAEQYPAFEFLTLAATAGVPVLINSDAHAPVEVGYQFTLAEDLLRQAGYRQTCRFEGRRRYLTPLAGVA